MGLPPRSGAQTKTLRIGGLLYDGALLLDLVAPLEAFNFATLEIAGSAPGSIAPPAYTLCYLASRDGETETSIGLSACADRLCYDLDEPLDILVVPGQTRGDIRYRDERLFQWLREQAATSCRIMSICTGAYLLAEAGILSGRTITTHWAHGNAFRQLHPDVEVLDEKLFHRDDRLYSSGGVSSGVDLALFMIEEDFGRTTALRVAKRMVVYLRRQGNQSQYSEWLALQSKTSRFARVIDWVEHNLASKITIEVLSDVCSMSPRNFSRQFSLEFGSTPMAYVMQRRLSYAKQLLENSATPTGEIAQATGFRNDSQFRRAFQRAYSISPLQHRAQFGL